VSPMYPLAHVSKRASAETGDRDRAKFATGGGRGLEIAKSSSLLATT
jgi:hypothetical protein